MYQTSWLIFRLMQIPESEVTNNNKFRKQATMNNPAQEMEKETDPRQNLDVPSYQNDLLSESSFQTACFETQIYSFNEQIKNYHHVMLKDFKHGQKCETSALNKNQIPIRKMKSSSEQYYNRELYQNQQEFPWEQMSLGIQELNQEKKLKSTQNFNQKTFEKLRRLERTVKMLRDTVKMLKVQLTLNMTNCKFLQNNVNRSFNIMKDEHLLLKTHNEELKNKINSLTQENKALKLNLEDNRVQLISKIKQNSQLVNRLKTKEDQTIKNAKACSNENIFNSTSLNQVQSFIHKPQGPNCQRMHTKETQMDDNSSFKKLSICKSLIFTPSSSQLNSDIKNLRQKVRRLKDKINRQESS